MKAALACQYIHDDHIRRTLVSSEARKLMDEKPLVFDTETTGLMDMAEVVEICVLSHDKSVLMDTLVRPKLMIPESATAVHGISWEDVENERGWEKIHPIFVEALRTRPPRNRILTGYNLAFDIRVVNQSSRLAMGLPIKELPLDDSIAIPFCIMELYAIWHGTWNERFRSYTWQPLNGAMNSFGIEREGDAHRARSDAMGALEVLKAMAAFS